MPMYSEQHIFGGRGPEYGIYSGVGLFLALKIMNTGFILDLFTNEMTEFMYTKG